MSWFAQRRLLKLVAVLAALLGAAVAYVSLQPDELASYKRQLAAKGEELSLAKLSPPFSKEAVEHHQHFDDLVARLVTSPIEPGEIDLMHNGTVARIAWTRPRPVDCNKGTWANLSEQMTQSEPALLELRRHLAKPLIGSQHNRADRYYSTPTTTFVSRRKAALVFSGSAISSLHYQRLDAALTNLHALILLSRQKDDGDMLVDTIIPVAIANLAVEVTWEALQSRGWDESRLVALQREWQKVELATRFTRALEMERASAIGWYDYARTNRSKEGNIFEQGWGVIWGNGDELRFLRIMQPIVESTRLASAKGSYHNIRVAFAEAMREIQSRKSTFDKLRFPTAYIVLPNWQSSVAALVRYETQRQMALTAIALKRHELKHGKLPANLAALTPDFLSSQPIDHLDGQPLTYHRLSDHRFTLRSAGDNERDEGGAGDDLVWPEPELSTDSSLSSRQ